MADPRAPSPNAEQVQRQRQLETQRLIARQREAQTKVNDATGKRPTGPGRVGRFARSAALSGSLMMGGIGGAPAPAQPQIDPSAESSEGAQDGPGSVDQRLQQVQQQKQKDKIAEKTVEKGLDALSKAPDARVKAAVAAAKATGADKLIAKSKEAQAIAGAIQGLQNADPRAFVRARSLLWRRGLWTTFTANLVEPFSAFFVSLPAVQGASFLAIVTPNWSAPLSIGEIIGLILATMVQIAFVLSVIALGAVVYCMVAPSCQYDLVSNVVDGYLSGLF